MTAATSALLIDGSTAEIRPAAPHDEDAVRLPVRTLVPGARWLLDVQHRLGVVSEVGTPFQSPSGHTADELDAGGGVAGENVICPCAG
jgi:hypothetical protein